MKAWKTVFVFVCVILLMKLGIQAALAGAGAVLVTVYGPRRLRKLHREDRESAALHMLAMLLAAMASIILSLVSAAGGDSDQAALLGVASWLCVFGGIAVITFHVVSFPTRKPAKRRPDWGREAYQERTLPKAS